MGDLANDTEVQGDEGHYVAELSPEWDVWGPNGGYVAAVALKAAAKHTSRPRVASMTCHFLSAARFAPVDITVRTMRSTRRADSVLVSMSQEGKSITETLAWLVADGIDGLAHDTAPLPPAPGPDGLRSFDELIEDGTVKAAGHQLTSTWKNIEWRPVPPKDDARDRPYQCGWFRYRPRARYDDPYSDAARALPLLDSMGFAATNQRHGTDHNFVAPNMDLSVQFHRMDAGSEWLFAEGSADVAEDGLIGYQTRVWAQSGELLATGSGQLLCRALPR